jgi:hypothetical protein
MTLNDLIREYLRNNPERSNLDIARDILKNHSDKTKASEATLQTSIYRIRNGMLSNGKRSKVSTPPNEQSNKKKEGFEQRGEKIVVNWSTKTVITDLGEFDTFTCSFDTHSRIQRQYVYAEGNETAAVVAMNFNFPHAKAVHLYARLHGFSKASIPQTDLELEEGLSAEDAVQQNLQSMKRQIHKDTEKAKWKETQKAAEQWWRFEQRVLEPFKDFIEELHVDGILYEPTDKLNLKELKLPKREFSTVIGLSDWHFLKLCYDQNGKEVYNKEIAKQKINDHTYELMQQVLMYGRPSKIFVPVGGNDNIHVDGPEHETTAGTSQTNATDGIWRIGVKQYLQITIAHIRSLAQIAPVEVACFPGNHDEKTAILMAMFLEELFENDPRVTVKHSLYPRLYFQYEKNCLIFTHGHHLGNRKLQQEIHKIILGEARQHNIDLNNTDNYLLFTGHDHVGSFQDLNGNVQHFIMPSLAGTDDFWHIGQGYMGRAMESAAYLIYPEEGRKAIVYSSK